jgi:hypothetical protein
MAVRLVDHRRGHSLFSTLVIELLLSLDAYSFCFNELSQSASRCLTQRNSPLARDLDQAISLIAVQFDVNIRVTTNQRFKFCIIHARKMILSTHERQ